MFKTLRLSRIVAGGLLALMLMVTALVSVPASQAASNSAPGQVYDINDQSPLQAGRGVGSFTAQTSLSQGWVLVFVRTSGANGLGHVGWGFQTANDTYSFGSTENPSGQAVVNSTDPNAIGWWAHSSTTQDMFNQMRGRGYNGYKILLVNSPTIQNARNTAVDTGRHGYKVVGNNCADATYRIMAAYGVPGGNLPWLQNHPAPNSWYNALTENGWGNNNAL